MIYRLDRRRERRKYINIALSVLAFGLFLYFWPAFKIAAYPLAEPVVRGYGGAKDMLGFLPSSFTTYFSSRETLQKEKENLELEIERLENELAQKDAMIREMETLVSSGAHDRRVITLYPIAQDITKLYSTILLSKGYRDGIEKGGMVYVRGLQPVCEIVDVYERTSLCELLSKGNRITEAVTASSSITLSLVGAGGGSFIAEVPNDTPIEVGETVRLRGDPSFVLGSIVAIKKDDQATGSKVYVRGAYNPTTSSVFYLSIRYAP